MGRRDLAVDRIPEASLEVLLVEDASFGTAGERGPRRPHRHDYHELIWTRCGTGHHLIDGEVVPVEPTVVTLIDRGQVHVFERASGLYGAVVRFGDELLHADPDARSNPGWLLGSRGARSVAVPDHYALLYPAREELAWDRERDQWPTDLGYAHGPAPLDFDSLFATVSGEQPPASVGEGLRMGHLHLHVGDIAEGLAFYRDVLGFEEQANLGTAAFVSAGGYHHHLGFNVWNGRGVGPAPEHTAGLRHWTVQLPTEADVAEVRARVEAAGHAAEPVAGGFLVCDPWKTAVAFVVR